MTVERDEAYRQIGKAWDVAASIERKLVLLDSQVQQLRNDFGSIQALLELASAHLQSETTKEQIAELEDRTGQGLPKPPAAGDRRA